MSEQQIEAHDPVYNASIPANWWLSDEWRPAKWAYGPGEAGHLDFAESPKTPVFANNAYLMALYFRACGWCMQSVAALCGNVQGEGAFNPGDWENWGNDDRGFGLVQWTPARKYFRYAINKWGENDPWAPYYYSGWYECYILALTALHRPAPEPREWSRKRQGDPGPSRDYWLTMAEWAAGQIPAEAEVPVDDWRERVSYLTSAFLWCYEKPSNPGQTEIQRITRAQTWYERLTHVLPDFTSRGIKQHPQKPGPFFKMGDIRMIQPWLLKAFANNNHRTGGFLPYAR